MFKCTLFIGTDYTFLLSQHLQVLFLYLCFDILMKIYTIVVSMYIGGTKWCQKIIKAQSRPLVGERNYVHLIIINIDYIHKFVLNKRAMEVLWKIVCP